LGRGEENNEVILQEKKMFRAKVDRKGTFSGLKAYLRATDHICSNIISRDKIGSQQESSNCQQYKVYTLTDGEITSIMI
jgi:hypothetical protein